MRRVASKVNFRKGARMKNLFKTVALAAVAFGSLLPAASADLLAGEEINQTIAGKRINLQVQFGLEFPMHYQENGNVTGDGSGTGLGKYFAPKETGNWWISGNEMCQQFPTWYKGRSLCFKLRRTGPNELEWIREDGKTGTARILG